MAGFQRECGSLLLDAETVRVQTQSCEDGIRALEEASRALAGSCDVLGRRAGLTQTHALMARCASEDAADALQRARDRSAALGRHLASLQSADPALRALCTETEASLAEADKALASALERGGEAARVAAELGGSAGRGERVALSLGEACEALAPSLAESARTGLRLSMLAAGLDESAGRVSRVLEAAATGRPVAVEPRPQPRWQVDEVPAAPAVRVTQAEGNVLWVSFGCDASRDPGVEQA